MLLPFMIVISAMSSGDRLSGTSRPETDGTGTIGDFARLGRDDEQAIAASTVIIVAVRRVLITASPRSLGMLLPNDQVQQRARK